MPVYVNTNVAAINAQHSLSRISSALNKSLERLASGYRINRGADDPAGIQIAEKLKAQILSNQQAYDNIQDGLNVLDIADSALSSISENLSRMRELAVEAGNDTLTAAQRTSIEDEMDQLATEITRISDSTEFNGKKLLNGTYTAASASYRLMVGSSSSASESTIDVASGSGFGDIDATVLAVDDANINVDSTANALTVLDRIDSALNTVNSRRGSIGAYMNRLEYASNNIETLIENQTAAEGRIRNVDVAAETTRLVTYQILQEAATTILSQANQLPSIALTLLKGN